MHAELTGTPAADETSDAVLLLHTREGDTEAFGSLYLRHVASARVLARQLARDPSEADELVAESFTRVLGVVQRGAGPEAAFRPYLLSTMRRLHIDRRVAERKTEPTDDLTPHDPGEPFVDLPADELERSIVSSAFTSLPERWRLVLWHTEVEGLSPAQVAPLLGISANATAALAVRARAGLRDAYLSAHVTSSEPGCREIGASLGGYVRGTLSRRERVAVDQHLDSCARCSAAVLELSDTAATMRGVIGPLILGGAVLAYREGLLALGPHAIPSAALLHTTGAAALHGAAGAGTTGGAAGGSASSGGSGAAAAAANAGRPAWQLIGAAAVAGAVVLAAAVAFALTGGSPNRTTAGGATSGATSAVPSAGPTPDATPTPSPTSGSTSPSPSSTGGTGGTGGANPTQPAVNPVDQTSPTTSPTTPAPTTTPPVPVAAPATVGNLMAVGDLVRGRTGYLSLRTTNPGAGAVTQTVVLNLPPGVTFNASGQVSGQAFTARGAAFGRATVAAAAGSAGPCAATAGGITCSLGVVAAGANKDFVVPVSVADLTPATDWSGTLTSQADSQTKSIALKGSLTFTGDMGVNALFAGQGTYQVTSIGNSLMSCQNPDPKAPIDPKCAAVEKSRTGPDLTNDAGHWVLFGRNDMGAGWASSSTGKVGLPSGGTVVRAWLTWSATGVSGPTTQTATIQAPGAKPTKIDADGWTDLAVSGAKGYVAVADVTELVAGGGSGDWTVGNIDLPLKPANQVYGGWSLMVLTSSPTAAVQNVTVLGGPHLLGSGTDWTGHALGLRGGAADLTLVAWEGDAGNTGDSVSVHGQALTPRDGNSGSDDAAASYSIGALTRDGAPQGLTFGTDVREFAATSDPSDTSGDITLKTVGDNYVLGLLAVTTGNGAAL